MTSLQQAGLTQPEFARRSMASRQRNQPDIDSRRFAMKSRKPLLRLAASAAPDRTGGFDDSARFANVVMPHIDDAYRLALWLTGNSTDAEDVVQDASLQAFRAIRGFAGASARAWLLSIVRHTTYYWLRKNRPTAIVTVDDLGSRACAIKSERPESRNAGGCVYR